MVMGVETHCRESIPRGPWQNAPDISTSDGDLLGLRYKGLSLYQHRIEQFFDKVFSRSMVPGPWSGEVVSSKSSPAPRSAFCTSLSLHI